MEPHATNIVNENIQDENGTCTTGSQRVNLADLRGLPRLPRCGYPDRGTVVRRASEHHPTFLVKLLFFFRGVGLGRSAPGLERCQVSSLNEGITSLRETAPRDF